MKRAFTTREKVMLLVLTVLLIVIAYFKLILEPINNSIDEYQSETAAEQARFWARFFGHDPDIAAPAMKRVGLSSRADVPGRGLSAGQKRRLALARLLLDPRPVWLLDEPLAALDVAGQKLVSELLAAHVTQGGMALVATHQPLEIEVRHLMLGAA